MIAVGGERIGPRPRGPAARPPLVPGPALAGAVAHRLRRVQRSAALCNRVKPEVCVAASAAQKQLFRLGAGASAGSVVHFRRISKHLDDPPVNLRVGCRRVDCGSSRPCSRQVPVRVNRDLHRGMSHVLLACIPVMGLLRRHFASQSSCAEIDGGRKIPAAEPATSVAACRHPGSRLLATDQVICRGHVWR